MTFNILIDRTLAPGRLDELISPLFERSLDRERTVQNRIKQLKSDKREMKKLNRPGIVGGSTSIV